MRSLQRLCLNKVSDDVIDNIKIDFCNLRERKAKLMLYIVNKILEIKIESENVYLTEFGVKNEGLYYNYSDILEEIHNDQIPDAINIVVAISYNRILNDLSDNKRFKIQRFEQSTLITAHEDVCEDRLCVLIWLIPLYTSDRSFEKYNNKIHILMDYLEKKIIDPFYKLIDKIM